MDAWCDFRNFFEKRYKKINIKSAYFNLDGTKVVTASGKIVEIWNLKALGVID